MADSANIARFLPEMAAQVPAHCACKLPLGRAAGGRTIRYLERSFAELEAESNAVARRLQQRGIQRGTRTLLMVRPGLELIQLTFALFKIGAVPVVIDPGMGRKNFLACVRRTQPEALVGIPLAHLVSRVFGQSFASLRSRVGVGRSWQKQVAQEAAQSNEPVLAVTAVEELAAILFTSGSTGPPKGVCYEHGMFEAQVRLIRGHYGIQPGEVDLPMLPIFALFNPAMGMTTVVPEMNPSKPATVDPAKIVQAIQQNAVTNSFGSPVLWGKIAAYCEARRVTLPTLKRVLMAGAPVPPSLMERFQPILPHGEIHTPYGATECLPISSISATEVLKETRSATLQGHGTCVGRLIPEIAAKVIRITDAPIPTLDAAEPLPPGQIGEIIVRGPVVTKAYDQLPDKTADAKIMENAPAIAPGSSGSSFPLPPSSLPIWHRMGDVGYVDAQGRLWFCGRKAERVETPDGPLYTDQIEPLINAHEAVYRSALIGLGEPGQQRPVIVVEPTKGTSEADLRPQLEAFLGEQPGLNRIAGLAFFSPFPVDVRHNAKIHRLTLQQHFEAHPERIHWR